MKFPQAELPHNSVVEWWYLNGFLRSGKRKYAFMHCLFKAMPAKADIPVFSSIAKRLPVKSAYFVHSIFYDIAKKQTSVHILPIMVPSKDSFNGRFFVSYVWPALDGYVVHELSRTGNRYKLKNNYVDLELRPLKRALLEGGRGFIKLEPGISTYYYSLTRLETHGKVFVGRSWQDVDGLCWMDHQWANVAYDPRISWDWFCAQLSNGTDIVCFRFRRNKEFVMANIFDRNGRLGIAKDVLFIPGKAWISPKSGASYPTEWSIKIPSRSIALRLRAEIADCEVLFGTINYWEGPVRIKGTMNGERVDGWGFAELFGYPKTRSALRIYVNELRELATGYFSVAKRLLFG